MPEFGVGGGSATDIPLARIQDLKAQGQTNNQIIQTLQRQGYTTTQIFDALNQAAVQPAAVQQKTGSGPTQGSSSAGFPSGPMGGMPSPFATQGLNSAGAGRGRMDPPGFPPAGPRPPGMMPMGQSFDGGSDTEEMIEAIIDEKWNDLMADINKVISWKEATEARLAKMEQQMTDMKDSFDKLQAAVVGKVGEYDQHILEVGAEVKAMEKVFSKVLPVFTDNVAELSRVADQMKRNMPTPSSSAQASTSSRR